MIGPATAAGCSGVLTQWPFLRLRWDGAQPHAEGTAQAVLGHRLPARDGERPDGLYVEWNWDGRSLTLRTDRYGFFPLYYFAAGTDLCLSPSIPRLIELGAPRELDFDALGVFLRLGYFLGCDTPFRHIRAFPPGCTLRWEQGRTEIKSEKPQVAALSISRNAAIDEYVERFRAAIHRRPCAPEQCVLPLSGGRDSRHILLELVAANRSPAFSVTVDPRFYWDGNEHPEIIAARELSARAGVEHVVIRQQESRLATERRKNLLTSLCSDEHTAFLALADALDDRTRVIFDGLAGDILSAGLFLNAEDVSLFERGELERLANRIVGNDAVLRRLLSTRWMDRLHRRNAVQRVAQELRQHDGQRNPVGSFYFWNRTRREIALAPMCLFGGTRTVYCPYLDHEVYDFLAGLPAAYFLDHTFHTEAIARGYPEFADVPYCGARPAPDKRHARRVALEALILARRSAFQDYSNLWGTLSRYGRQVIAPRGDGWASINRTIYLEQLRELQQWHPRDPSIGVRS